MSLLYLLEMVLIVGILFGMVYAVVQFVGLPQPWPSIAYGILAIIAVIMIFGFIAGIPFPAGPIHP